MVDRCLILQNNIILHTYYSSTKRQLSFYMEVEIAFTFRPFIICKILIYLHECIFENIDELVSVEPRIDFPLMSFIIAASSSNVLTNTGL